MMMQTLPALLVPQKGETVIDYWMSMSPVAPVFGLEWRFSPLFREVMPNMASTPAMAGSVVLTEGDLHDEDLEEAEEEAKAVEAAEADDLTALKGVGPKMAAELNAMGLTSFAQLAQMTEANIAELSENLTAFRDRPVRDDWVGQARALMGQRT